MKYTIYTDGGARGNPGPAAIGVVIHGVGNFKERIGEATNNIAEYKAVILAFQKLKHFLGDKSQEAEVEVNADSELIVRQLKGEYQVKNEGLRVLFLEAQKLRQNFKSVQFNHIRREKNKEADALVNMALDNE